MLEKLDSVMSQLGTVITEKAKEISVLTADLESEKEARRGWQDKAVVLRERLQSMVRSSFVCQPSTFPVDSCI